jgi:hypothetical protein
MLGADIVLSVLPDNCEEKQFITASIVVDFCLDRMKEIYYPSSLQPAANTNSSSSFNPPRKLMKRFFFSQCYKNFRGVIFVLVQ